MVRKWWCSFPATKCSKESCSIASYPQKRLNENLGAENIIEIDLEHDVVVSCYEEVADILGAGYFEDLRKSTETGIGLYSVCPGWNGDLRWISSGNNAGFAFFDKYFAQLDVVSKVKQLLGDLGELIMYSGFFVVRSHTSESYYHEDYGADVGLNAFTLMTPVASTGEVGNLLYHDVHGNEQVYKYSCGRGVCFGGGFYHSTEPFESPDSYVFLCFTFGVSDMKHWDSISQTAAEQGLLYRHPERGVVKVDA